MFLVEASAKAKVLSKDSNECLQRPGVTWFGGKGGHPFEIIERKGMCDHT